MSICIVHHRKHASCNALWVNTTSTLSAGGQGPGRPVLTGVARHVSQLGSGTRLMGQIASGLWVSASFQKNACLVGRLGSGSGPHLMCEIGSGVWFSAIFRKKCPGVRTRFRGSDRVRTWTSV